jgi:RND family efflux transporter MFP subunit
MRIPSLALSLGALVLAGCGDASGPAAEPPQPPFVRTAALAASPDAVLALSGTIRARVESPLAFQVTGRIARREVDAGQLVDAAQLLFELDKRDLEQGLRSAEADVAAAAAGLATAEAELARMQQLQTKSFVSAQEMERAQLARREAEARRDAALARASQARNALEYGRLEAPAAGVLIDVTGEPGQVVTAGQAVAVLAQAGEREVEVHFPGGVAPPQTGEAVLGDGGAVPLRLRETAGAVDPQSRTRRARYTALDRQEALVLGAVVYARFAERSAGGEEFQVALGALDERGHGPRVWRFGDGRVAPVPVTVVAIEGETARIRGPLAAGDRIVTLGTHLLTDDMAARELAR